MSITSQTTDITTRMITASIVVKRGRGRPRLAPEDRKSRAPRKAVARPIEDNTNKLQCFRCLVFLPKDQYKLKRSGTPYKNCKHCIEYMKSYRELLKSRQST